MKTTKHYYKEIQAVLFPPRFKGQVYNKSNAANTRMIGKGMILNSRIDDMKMPPSKMASNTQVCEVMR